MNSPSTDLIKQFTDENAGLMFAYFLVNILTLAMETIVMSILLSKVFSSIGKKGDDGAKNAKKLFVAFVGVFILVRLGYFLRSVIYDEIIPSFFYFLRTRLYNKIIERYRIDYKELNIGYVLYNFGHLPSSFKKLITELLQEYIPNLLALLVCLCYLFYTNKAVGTIVLLGTIVFAIIIILTITKSIDLSAEEHSAFEHDNEHIQDRLNNLFDIYTAGTEHEEKQEFVDLENNLKQKMINDYKYTTMVISIIEVFTIFILAGSFYVLYNAYNNKSMTNENIISVILVLTYFLNYFSKISGNYIGISDALGYSKESDRFIKEINATELSIPQDFSSNLRNISHIIGSPSIHGPIEFKNVNFSYPNSKKVLNGTNLYIKPGTKVAIFGKSGSGKSTLAKLLLGFYSIDSGLITIGERNIKDIGIDELRQNMISYVNQNNNRLFDKSIMENMTYGLDNQYITEDDIKKIIGNTNIFENITGGLNANVGVSGSKLSGGQKQLILLSRSLLRNTPILLLDEPTSALDKNTKNTVINIIKNLKNKTVIIITHDPSIISCVDKVYEFVNGKLKIK
jgi:ABC-type multidrug transport system fused ATPase/permease subunit